MWEKGGLPTGNYGILGTFELLVECFHDKLSFLFLVSIVMVKPYL